MSKLIIDISHHHRVKNWDKLQENVSLLITKITEGSTFVDPYVGTIVNECEKRKIPYFLYHYLRKGNVSEQIGFYLKKVQDIKGKYFCGYCLDVEEGNTLAEVQKAVKELNSKVTDKCLLYYMYADYHIYGNVTIPDKKKWSIWEARYGRNTTKYSSKYPCHSIADLHQFCSVYTASWVHGGIDVNRLTGRKNLNWFTGVKSSDKLSNVSHETYFKKCSEKETSIAEALKKNGYAYNYKYRNRIAEVNGIKNYAGTSKQNITLLSLMKKGKLCKPL